MTKQNQAAEAKSGKKSRPKVKPTAVEELTDELANLAQLAGGPIAAAGDGTIQAQAARLGDPRLQTAQRQALAAQVGRLQGNGHLQRVISHIHPPYGRFPHLHEPVHGVEDWEREHHPEEVYGTPVGGERETPPSREVSELSQETADAAQQHIASNRQQDAINVVVQALVDQGQINLSHIEDETIRYDPDLPPGHYGHTSATPGTGSRRPSRVRIGRDAFRSVGVLYSTIMHEYQHVLQHLEEEPTEEAVGEVEAYFWEIEHLEQTGAWQDSQYMHTLPGSLRHWWGRLTPEQQEPLQERYDQTQDTLREMQERLQQYQLELQRGGASAQRATLQMQYERADSRESGAPGSVVQAKATGPRLTVAVEPPVAKDPGHIASAGTIGPSTQIPYKEEMEELFDEDFSDVGAYTGKESKAAADMLGAEAFTVGNTIAFSEDNPSKKTVAHELTHVVQQGGSHTGHIRGKTSPTDRAEQEAASVEQAISSGQPIPTISEELLSSTVAGRFYLRHGEVVWGEVVWAVDYDQRQERIVAWIDVITGEGGEVSEIPPRERERIGSQTLPASAIEARLGLPPGSLVVEEHNPEEGTVYFGILNPEDNIPLVRRQIGAIEARERGWSRVPGEGAPPGPATNNPDALARASLEMLCQLYATQQRLHRLMPTEDVFSRDWVMSPAGTALLRGTIRWKLADRLGQLGQRQHLLSYVDDSVRGSEPRKAELRALINEAFDRVAEVGLEAAQQTAPALVDIGRQGRTWTPRRPELAPLTMHAAMDVPGPEGTGVYSPLEGQVVFSDQSPTYGHLVRVLHESPPRTAAAGEGPVVTSYAHLAERLVSVGDQVRAGQAVGTMGATGIPGMGVHLHFSVMRAPGGRVTRLTSGTEEIPRLSVHPDHWLSQIGRVSIFATRHRTPTRRRRSRASEAAQRQVQRQPQLEAASLSDQVMPEAARRTGERASEIAQDPRPAAAGSQEAKRGPVQRYIPATDLPAFGTAQQTAFMRRVYELQRQRSARQRTFVGDLPANQLGVIESGVQARRDAAAACRMLLHAARQALAEQQRSGDRLATQVHSIGVASGYRSARRQFQNWRRNFPRYYRQTQAARARLPGGEHGDAAARHLARYISGRLAAPGYSLHNSGIAIDFRTRQGRHNLGPSTAQIALWNRSWFFRWLSANAANFGFAQNPNINEPWHWELVTGVELIEFSAQEGEVITPD